MRPLRLTLRVKLLAIVISTSFAFLVVIGASTVVNQHVRDQLVSIEQRHIPKLEIGPLIAADFAALPRGYQDAVAAHDIEALAHTTEIRDRILRRITTGAGAEPGVLDPTASAAFRTALNDYHDTAIAVSRRMLSDESGEAIVDAIRDMQGKQAKAQKLLERLVAFDQNDLKAAFQASREALDTGAQTRLAVSMLSLFISLALSIWVMRGLVRSLAGIHHGFTRFGKGLLDDPIPVVGSDELADVAKQANKMAASLSEIDQVKSELLDRTQEQANRLLAQEEELRSTNEQLVCQQEELRQTNEELAEYSRELGAQRLALQARNIDLQEAGRHLEQKAAELATVSAYKSQFLANMSHELRTPLNSMLLLSNLLAENGERNLTAKQVEYARTVNGAGRDLLALINQVLDLAKVEAGKQDVQIAPARLQDVAAHIQRVFAPLAKEKDVDLIIEIAEGLPESIATDSQRVGQILVNLVGNAIKFTPRNGHVKLRIDRPSPSTATKFRRGTRRPEATVAFAVSDTGVGIAPEDQQRVFAPFEQVAGVTNVNAAKRTTSGSLPRVGASSIAGSSGGSGAVGRSSIGGTTTTMQRGHGGTGLGLSIARELATLLGGELHLHSVVGAGSTFTLYLPHEATIPTGSRVAEDSSAAAGLSAASSSSSALLADDANISDLHILVIEDDPVFSEVLSQVIQNRGLVHMVAKDGETGLRMAREHRPRGIILDVRLPDIDGWQVMEGLRADPITRAIPVHFVSAVDMPDRAFAMGAAGYLVKPVERQDLGRVVEALAPKPVGAGREEQRRRILVVEEEPPAQPQAGETTPTLLEQLVAEGIDAVRATSGRAALELLDREESFACMIVDLSVPEMGGLAMLEELRQKKSASSSPMPAVVIYTNRALDRAEAKRFEAYSEAVVVKDGASTERLLSEIRLFVRRLETGSGSARSRSVSPAAADVRLEGKKILVVDDDMRTVYALSATLRAKGAEVLVGETGVVALAVLEEHPNVDAVLMDVMMPEMDGYEATRRIRAQTRFAELPIIALTAKAMKGDEAKCRAAGASDYLPKPIDADALLTLLHMRLMIENEA